MKPSIVCQKYNILLLPVATSKRTFSRLNIATRVKRRQNDAFCDMFCHHILRQGDIVHIVGDIKFHSEKIHQKLGNMESRKMVILLAGKPYRIMSCKAVIYCSQRDDLPIYIPCVLYFLHSLITRTFILIWKARGIKQSSSFFFLKSFCIGLVWLYGLCPCQSLTRKSLVIVWNVVLLLHPYHFYVQFVVLQRYYIIYRNMSLVFAFLNTCLVYNLYLS